MSGLGRGNLFNLVNAQEKEATMPVGADSGLGTRVGRGRIIDDVLELGETLESSSLSGGRGRAASIFGRGQSSPQDSSRTTISSGCGRAQILSSYLSLSSLDTRDSASSYPKETTTSVTDEEEKQTQFFKPEICYSERGIPVNVACNYIRISSDPKKGVFVYEVRFVPNIDSVQLRVKYLNEHREKIGVTKTFDGSVLYLPIKLEKTLTSFNSKTADGSNVQIRINFKKEEPLKNCLQLYNVLFDRVMKTLNYVRFNRKQFDPSAPKIIPQAKLEVWPGYVTAVDEYDGGLMLCCDVSHRLLCQKTVLDMLIEIYQSNSRSFYEMAKKSLLGSIVITRYNNKTYRVDDLCFDKTPFSTFFSNGTEITYMDYYRKHHNIIIKDHKQPLILSLKKQRTYDPNQSNDLIFCLIPELCYLTGINDEMRSDLRLMREIATFTRVTPNQRLFALKKFIQNVNDSVEARTILANWGLRLTDSHETLTARNLGEEEIFFGKKSFKVGENGDFSRYAVNSELLKVINLNKWLVLYTKPDATVTKSFCDNMQLCSKALGIVANKPELMILPNERIETYVNALRANITKDHQIVVCICPSNRHDTYAAIKKVCCAEIPIPSQVIIGRTLKNETKNRSIVQKIALQMNCKMGGTLWSIKIPFKNVMICGIDSYHDPSSKQNSVSAFVSSLNQSYTEWSSKAVMQSKKEEIVNGLCALFIEALDEYEKINNRLPDSVIIYRDGVGDGQLKLCAEYEIPQFEHACEKRNYNVKITFIVIQKRINTRYFTFIGNETCNPVPGTVVDQFVTRKNMYDFFLISQSVRQGTVSPTHYVVLRDDSNLGPYIIQKLSYKLCFMYYNWPGPIRVPACSQYAHKMAYLIGQCIRKDTAPELCNKLFYL